MYEIIPTENICPVKLILLGISNTVLNNNAVPSKACVTLSLCILQSSILVIYFLYYNYILSLILVNVNAFFTIICEYIC